MNTFDQVIGYEAEKRELIQISDMLRNRDRYEALGAKLPKGLLIYGAPGLGKTLMARCFIENTGWKSYTIRRNRPDGDFVRELSRVFEEAAQSAPAIILLDDMDKFVVEEKSKEEFVAIQAGIDSVKEKDVYVVATANDLDDIPESLLRAGRFDRKIEVESPCGQSAQQIITHYLSGKSLSADVNLSDVAKMLQGSSCAELETMLNEAAILAGYEHSEQIQMRHIVEVVLRDMYGADSDCGTSEAIGDRLSYHEAGHAVMQELLCRDGVGLVSVRPRANGCRGFMRICAHAAGEKANVLISLAGVVAEELKYGVRGRGGSEDLQKAIRIIRDDITEDGTFGVHLLNPTRFRSSDAVSTQQEAVIAAELERYMTLTRTILVQNRAFLDTVAGELCEKGTLLNSDICRIREKRAVMEPNTGLYE